MVVLDPDEKLLPDMSVRVVFYEALPGEGGDGATGRGDGAVVPRSALRRDDGGRPFVWTVEDGRTVRVPVELGDVLGDRVIVDEGLAGGETLVVGEAPEHEGARVAPPP